jgi:GNAT superfamily N-acetyltransferase
MSVEIKEVLSKKDLKRFIKFSLELYKDNEYVAPKLTADELVTLDRKKNPAFDFCESAYFLAYKDGKIVGRIAAIINHSANEHANNKNGRFGWVDFIDDREVSAALFQRAESWLKAKGMTAIVGPIGITDLDYEGLLIEGFDRMSTMATIYNYPYYASHIEALGYIKEVDWNEYLISVPDKMPERFSRGVELIKQKYGLRSVEFKSRKELVKNYGQKVFDLWNVCYSELYGASPLTQKQINHYVKIYLSFICLDTLSLIVDKDDNVVGFGVSIPSLTKALRKAKGHLWPFGIIHVLNALRKGKNDTVDLLIVGIHPAYQNKGAISLLFGDLIPKYIKRGFKYAESNPELESNVKITAQWGTFEYENHKKRRAFIKQL